MQWLQDWWKFDPSEVAGSDDNPHGPIRDDQRRETLPLLTMAFGYAPWTWLQQEDQEAATRIIQRLAALGFQTSDLLALGLRPRSAEPSPEAIVFGDRDKSTDTNSNFRTSMNTVADAVTRSRAEMEDPANTSIGLRSTEDLLANSERARNLVEELRQRQLP